MYQLLMYGLARDLWGHKCPYLLLTRKGEGHAVMGRKHRPWCQELSSPLAPDKIKTTTKMGQKVTSAPPQCKEPFCSHVSLNGG